MRLSIVNSPNAKQFYVIKSFRENGKNTSKIVEKLGNYETLKKRLGGADPKEWAENYVAELNRKEKEGTEPKVIAEYLPNKIIDIDKQRLFNCSYLFLQKIYSELKLPQMCKEIKSKHKFEYNLDSILSRLIYGRIIFPRSKLATNELSKRFIEQPDFELHQIYKALDVIAEEFDFVQGELYKNSNSVIKRNTGVIYYDCTNFFFEIEQEDGLKQYGPSKEHRPSPIVQMGLFMDTDGIPLAFNINEGATNEQLTLRPLEKKLLSDFELSKFVVCTDAGLASTENRKFNDKGGRAFITTQTVKKLKPHIHNWVFDTTGWKAVGSDTGKSNKLYDISKIEDNDKIIYYKEQWFKEDGLEQKMIVTYSTKYKNYQRHIRGGQLERAAKVIEKNPTKLKKAGANDFKRFIDVTTFTADGDVAEKQLLSINEEIIAKEEQYDGYYAVCTNLEDKPEDIIAINQKRWEIEECFRIMKSEFRSRPVHLSRDNRIKAHFMTCFISLIIYRLLEKKLDNKFTCSEIISTLRDMNMLQLKGDGYIPAYTRTAITDALHDKFGFRTDYEVVTNKNMKNIFKITKK